MGCSLGNPCCRLSSMSVQVVPSSLPVGGDFTVTAKRYRMDPLGNFTEDAPDASYNGTAQVRVINPTDAVVSVGRSSVGVSNGVATLNGSATANTNADQELVTIVLTDPANGVSGAGVLLLPVRQLQATKTCSGPGDGYVGEINEVYGCSGIAGVTIEYDGTTVGYFPYGRNTTVGPLVCPLGGPGNCTDAVWTVSWLRPA